MNINDEVLNLKKEIDEITTKEECVCGKTLFFYDEKFIYLKCKNCGKIDKFNRCPTSSMAEQ
jgi:hypothetical protein